MAETRLRPASRRSGAPLAVIVTDGQLLEEFHASRDERAEDAFAALIERHGAMVLRVCAQILGNRHAAEDAFQACFLVLARRSRSIRHPDLLGNWLYGVALRTAREAKMRDGRRRQLEAPALAARDAQGRLDDAGRPETRLMLHEELEALHEEVARLPERYRVPVVLCEFEGLTYQEVGHRLSCPASTVGVRLVRARARLRTRLVRRGIVPTAVMAQAMLGGAEDAAALLSLALIRSTVRAATGFAARDAAAASLVPGAVIGLTRAVLKAMKVAQLKAAAGIVLAIGLTATLGWTSARRPIPPLPPVVEAPAAPVRSADRVATGPAAIVVPVLATPAPLPEPPRVEPAAAPPPIASPARVVAVPPEQKRGEALFFREWVANDPRTPHGDGLGPVFNDTSCVACHALGAPGGAGPETKNVVILSETTTVGRTSPRLLASLHPGFQDTRSTVLHRYGTDAGYNTWRRDFLQPPTEKPAPGKPGLIHEPAAARIQRIVAQTAPANRSRERSTRLDMGSGVNLRVSERNTPALFGVGQIDAIPAEVIVEAGRLQPAGVQGRVGRSRDGRVGRFGWKGHIASLHEFVRGACASELGLEVPGHAQSVSPLFPQAKPKGLDLDEGDCDALVAYVRALPAPLVIDPAGPDADREIGAGRQVFGEVGCASCHAPSLGDVRGIYSDLLLHNLGASLGDSGSSYGGEGPESPGDATPNEWRTPPLWGYRDSGPYLHDGRAQTLEEVVALHEGQGTKSAHQFFELSTEQQASVESFLKSLVAPATVMAPGIMLAADFEERIEPEANRQAEALIRHDREQAAAVEVEQQSQVRQAQQLASRQQQAEVAAKQAVGRFGIAVNLEKSGKPSGALEFYRMIVRDAPESDQARLANARIAELTRRP